MSDREGHGVGYRGARCQRGTRCRIESDRCRIERDTLPDRGIRCQIERDTVSDREGYGAR